MNRICCAGGLATRFLVIHIEDIPDVLAGKVTCSMLIILEIESVCHNLRTQKQILNINFSFSLQSYFNKTNLL